MTPMGLIKNFVAGSVIAKRRIVAFGASEGRMVQATSDAGIVGVSGVRGAAAIGERIDVYLSDIQPVEAGALINAGDYVTADADGKAIPAAPAADAQMLVIGRALETGPADAHINVLIQPQQITG